MGTDNTMAYKKDKTILISAWIITSILLVRFVPKERIREAQVIFLFNN